MAKIRAKNLKPKIAQDFKKKTAKVGRKVQPSNVTKINVKSKQIHIPLQAQITKKNAQNEAELVDKLLKQLSHYSGPFRESALSELKQYVSESEKANLYVALIVPRAMELLFDEDRDTRKSLLALMKVIMSKFSCQLFASISSVMATYLCSGLSSLHKVPQIINSP